MPTSTVLNGSIFARDAGDSAEGCLTYCWPESNAGDAEEQVCSGTEESHHSAHF